MAVAASEQLQAVLALIHKHAPRTDLVAQKEGEVLLAPDALQRLLKIRHPRRFIWTRDAYAVRAGRRRCCHAAFGHAEQQVLKDRARHETKPRV